MQSHELVLKSEGLETLKLSFKESQSERKTVSQCKIACLMCMNVDIKVSGAL